MVIWESFYLWHQHSEPWLVFMEMIQKISTGVPGVVRIHVKGCEDIEQVFDIHVLRSDPLRFVEPRLVTFEITQ
jgi:hypothetical protein